MWGARPDPELCASCCCCCPSGSSGGRSRDDWPAGLALSIPGGGGFTGLRLAGLGGTGLLGLGGITTGAAGAAGATGAAIVTGGCFHGRFFLGSGAGGRGSGL